MPELTVAMAAYNTEKYIREAIESVLRQKDVDFELIVIDDRSTDKTLEIIQSFHDLRIRLNRNEKRRGCAYCLNHAIRISEAPFFAIVDSDDMLIDERALKKSINCLKSASSIGQSHGYYVCTDENGRVDPDYFFEWRKNLVRIFSAERNQRSDILLYSGIFLNTLRVYKRNIFYVIGFFNESLLHGGEDWEMALRIIDRYDIGLIPEFLYAYRIRKKSLSRKKRWRLLFSIFHDFNILMDLKKSGKATYLRTGEYSLFRIFPRLLFSRMVYTLSPFIPFCVKNAIKRFLAVLSAAKYLSWVHDYPGMR